MHTFITVPEAADMQGVTEQRELSQNTSLPTPTWAQVLREYPDVLPSMHDVNLVALNLGVLSLPVELNRFLHNVSVFEDGWTVDAAVSVCDAPQANTWCEELLHRQLITCDTTREQGGYRIVQWFRTYLRSKMQRKELEALQLAHKAYYFTLAVSAAPHLRYSPDPSWMKRLKEDKANLLTAFERSCAEECLQFGMALWRWGFVSSYIDETRRILCFARFSCKLFPSQLLPEFYRAQGCTYYRKGEYALAKGYFEHAYHVACEQENWDEAAFSSQFMTNLLDDMSDRSAAKFWSEISLNLWQKVGSLWGQASILNTQGILAWREDFFNKARELFELSSRLCDQIDDKQISMKVNNNIGMVAQTQKEYVEAEQAYRKNLKHASCVPDKRHTCLTYNNLGEVCFKQKRFRQAYAFFRKSLVMAQEIGYTSLLPTLLIGLGQAAHMQGNDKFAILSFGLAEHLKPGHSEVFCISDRRVFEQVVAEIRRSVSPQMYGRLKNKGKNMTVQDIMDQMPS